MVFVFLETATTLSFNEDVAEYGGTVLPESKDE
jgi:hypothetical protein